MITLEKDIEKKLVEMVKRHGGVCLKWVCPGWSGVPDRIVLLPHARIFFVETKKPKGGKVSKLQKWWAKKLTDLGFSYWLIWNDEDLRRFEAQIRAVVDDEHERQTAVCYFCGRPFDTIRRREPGEDTHG